jgi:hypothetical protein
MADLIDPDGTARSDIFVAIFDISSSQDFYAMLVQDFDDSFEDQQSSRRAIHCAIKAVSSIQCSKRQPPALPL